MTNDDNQINDLHARLDALAGRQAEITREINHLRMEVSKLYTAQPSKEAPPVAVLGSQSMEQKKAEVNQPVQPSRPVIRPFPSVASQIGSTFNIKSDLEKFIGENLINKIGIIITILGVAIGAKYSIEHDLISPLTRIILGYLVGIGLLAFGMKLKKDYENFSAVLVSGAMAIMYFITYAAYALYQLIPQPVAFALLVAFTVFTVVAAISYNRQVIAHIGLVGAYAVPFLLSEEPDNANILFGYMTIINIGILVISFKKYWKPLYYSSFSITWLIFLSWFNNPYQTQEHFALGISYLTVFFLLFYASFLAYKLLRQEKFDKYDIVLLLINSFIYYGVGYLMLEDHPTAKDLLGLFTLANALVHFIIGAIIYRQKLADRNLFYFIAGLVLVFITIAIPVQLDGNWVTLLWVCEAALLFWIGRTKNVPIYEILSYPLMFIAFLSLLHDWAYLYGSYVLEQPETKITPLFNVVFLSSLLFIGAFVFINLLNQNKQYPSPDVLRTGLLKAMPVMLPAILIFTLYFALRMEIDNYYSQLIKDSQVVAKSNVQGYLTIIWNEDLSRYKTIWIINYTLLFASALSFINLQKLRSEALGLITLTINAIAILAFLIQGLYVLSELRESYILQPQAAYYHIGAFNLLIRYISYAFVAITLAACYRTLADGFIKKDLRMGYDLLLHISILWISSSELIHLLDLAQYTNTYKIGLSILWGTYSLLLIALGIWKHKKHLRIGAIGLFAVTLIKLFAYDISHLDTISKTIVFVSLGVLLLIISFLYNKYKYIISDEIKA